MSLPPPRSAPAAGYASHPPPHALAICLVLIAEPLQKFGFFQRDDDPVQIADDQREQRQRAELAKEAGFAEVGEGQADVHWVSRAAIRAPGDQCRRSFARHGGRAGAAKAKPAPTRDDDADPEQRPAAADETDAGKPEDARGEERLDG